MMTVQSDQKISEEIENLLANDENKEISDQLLETISGGGTYGTWSITETGYAQFTWDETGGSFYVSLESILNGTDSFSDEFNDLKKNLQNSSNSNSVNATLLAEYGLFFKTVSKMHANGQDYTSYTF